MFKTCYEAAEAGNLSELKRLHEAGVPWDDTITYAAAKGNLECLKYAHENGCPWEYWTISNSIPYLECFKYCFTNWSSPQEFWNLSSRFILGNIIDKIDLDDPVWRRLFDLNLYMYPQLQAKVDNKKMELIRQKESSMEALIDYLPKDIIQYCIHPLL